MDEEIEIDVDSIIGHTTPEPVEKADSFQTPLDPGRVVVLDIDTDPLPSPKKGEETPTFLKTRLENWENKCRDLFVDLKGATFHADENDMYLELDTAYYPKRLYFKSSDTDKKDAKVVHAHKQFCKMLGVPHAFFAKNRPTLKENIVRTWKAGQEDPKKTQVTARIREGKDDSMIRAILPVEGAWPLNHQMLQAIIDNMPGRLDLDVVTGDDRDDLILHARFLVGVPRDFRGRQLRPGFSLLCSQLGACALTLEALLHDCESKTSMVACFGGASYYQGKAGTMQLSDLKELIPRLAGRITEMVPDMLGSIGRRCDKANPFVLERETAELCGYGLSPAAEMMVYHQVTECSSEIHNPLDLARHACLVAKEYNGAKRISVERAAGQYLNLYFGRDDDHGQQEGPAAQTDRGPGVQGAVGTDSEAQEGIS